jgi:hypothetical protein
MCGSDATLSYLVECYWPGVDEVALAAAVRRTRAAAAALRRSGRRIDFQDSLLVPVDETVFCLFAGAEEDVRAVCNRAGLPFERVLVSLHIDGKRCA